MSATVQEEVTYSKRNRRKQLQYFFNYLKHAKKCHRKKKKDPITDLYRTNLCKLELCRNVYSVVSHKILMGCESIESCNSNILVCSSSSKILSHCKLCEDLNCFICLLIKGKKSLETLDFLIDSVSELRNYFGNLDLLCMLDDKDEIFHCSCGEPMTPGYLNYMDCNNGLKRLHLPGGLIIKNKEAVISETKTWHPSITPKQRSNHISGFFRTIFKEDDDITSIDKRSFYFLAFVTTIEKRIYESSDSKSEYIKSILETIKEIDEEFRNYRQKEDKLTVQNAVQKFFEGKITNDGLTKAELPNGLTYILGKPKLMSNKDEKLWQSSLTPADRQELLSKLYTYLIHDFAFIRSKLLGFLVMIMEMETTYFNDSESKEEYFEIVEKLNGRKLPGNKERSNGTADSMKQKPKLNKTLNALAGLPSNASMKKKSKPRNRKHSNQSEFDKSKNVTQKLSNPKSADSNVGETISDRPAFCFSHYLLLTCSVSYQLWKILPSCNQDRSFCYKNKVFIE